MRNRIHNIAEDVTGLLIEKLQAEKHYDSTTIRLVARVYKKTWRNLMGLAKAMEEHEANASKVDMSKVDADFKEGK